MKNILLIDDEPLFFDLLQVDQAADVCFHYLEKPHNLFAVIEERSIDLVLMDWNLGPDSGLDFVRLVRKHPRFNRLPIIMLTVNGDKKYVIEGLSNGANDFVAKPFDFEILVARIKAQLSKNESSLPIKLFPETFEVHIHESVIRLRRKEFLILKTLLENSERTFSRKDLNSITSGEGIFVSSRSVDTFIRYLRKKLPSPRIIQTIRGKGYRIDITFL